MTLRSSDLGGEEAAALDQSHGGPGEKCSVVRLFYFLYVNEINIITFLGKYVKELFRYVKAKLMASN